MVATTQEELDYIRYIAEAYASVPIVLTRPEGHQFLMMPLPLVLQE